HSETDVLEYQGDSAQIAQTAAWEERYNNRVLLKNQQIPVRSHGQVRHLIHRVRLGALDPAERVQIVLKTPREEISRRGRPRALDDLQGVFLVTTIVVDTIVSAAKR